MQDGLIDEQVSTGSLQATTVLAMLNWLSIRPS